MDILPLVALLLPIIIFIYLISTQNKDKYLCGSSLISAIFYLVIYIFLITFGGGTEEGSDKMRYTLFFEGFDPIFLFEYKDMGWYFYVYLCRTIFNDVNLFFFVTATIYCGGYFVLAYKKMTPYYTFLFLVVATGMMGFYGYGVNTIRNGLSLSFFLISLTFSRKWIYIPLFLLSISMHKGAILLIAVYYLTKYYRNINVYMLFWFICLVASAVGFSLLEYANLFDYTDDRLSMYSEMEYSGYNAGFRIDFVLYSFLPLLLSYSWIKKHRIIDDFYNQMFCMYAIMNSFWLLIIRIMFTNRFAYFSWALIPILLLYPFITTKIDYVIPKNILFRWVIVFFLIYIWQQLRGNYSIYF